MDSNKSCTFIESRTKFKGHFLSFMESDFEVNEKEKKSKITWEYVQYNLSSNIKFGVTIIPIIKKNNKIVIISNYRYAVKKFCLEFPSGLIEQKDENNSNDFDTIIKNTAKRELKEETNVDAGGYLYQFSVYGEVNRDPRTRVISIAYLALIPETTLRYQGVYAGDDAKEVQFFDIDNLPEQLAFDHATIIKDG